MGDTGNQREPVPARQRTGRRPKWRLWGLAAVVAMPALAWWWMAQHSNSVLRKAEALLETDPDRAAAMLEEAVQREGGDAPELQLQWTRALLRAGRPDEALGCFSLIGDPAAVDHAGLIILADEATANGSLLLARYALNAVPRESSERAAAAGRLMVLRQQAGDLETSRALAEELLVLQPDNPEPWIVLARIQEQNLEPHSAVLSYQEFLDRESDARRRSPALRGLSRLLIVLGERDAARDVLDQLLDTAEPDVADLLSEVRLLRLEGDQEAAWRGIQEVCRQLPDDPSAREVRGLLAFDRGDYADSILDFEAVLRVQPWSQQAHYKLAQALQRLGRAEEAGRHFEENRRLSAISNRILELQGATTTGAKENDRLNELAAAYDELGQWETAARFRERARRLERLNPQQLAPSNER